MIEFKIRKLGTLYAFLPLVKVKDTKQPLRKIAIQPWFLRFVYLFSLLLECI